MCVVFITNARSFIRRLVHKVLTTIRRQKVGDAVDV